MTTPTAPAPSVAGPALLPCPGCGSSVDVINSHQGYYTVRCADADCPLSVRVECINRVELAAWWNRRTPTNPTPPVEAEARGYARGIEDAAKACDIPTDQRVPMDVRMVVKARIRALAADPQGAGDGGGLLGEMAKVLRRLLSIVDAKDACNETCRAIPCNPQRARDVLARYDALTTTEREGGAPEVQPGDAGRGRTAEDLLETVRVLADKGVTLLETLRELVREGKCRQNHDGDNDPPCAWCKAQYLLDTTYGAGAPRKEQG
jgi:hypothetical protein